MYDGDRIGLWILCFAIVGQVRFSELARVKVTELFDELEIAHRDELLDNYMMSVPFISSAFTSSV